MDDNKLSLVDHLEELRRRIFIQLCAVIVMYIPGYLLAQPSIDLLINSLKRGNVFPADATLVYTEPMSFFFTQLSMGLVYALVFASPVLAYQTWQFVAPALFKHERMAISRLSGFSCLLFLIGVAFAIFLVFPALIRFSYGMATDNIRPMLQVDSVVYLAVLLMLGFGVMFQLPIVVAFLTLSGIVEIDTIKKARPYVVLVIFVLAAILTPPDVISQLAMGIPSWILFELSLLFVQASLRKKKELKAQEEPEEEEGNEEASPMVQPAAQNSENQARANNYTTPPDQGDYPNPDLYDESYHQYEPESYYPSNSDVSPQDKQVRIRNTTPAKHGTRGRRRNR